MGVNTTREVAGKLREITDGARAVNQLVAGIATASRAQAKEIHQIDEAVGQVSSMVTQVNSAMEQVRAITEQNAANSEESASVAEELSGQAKELEVMVRTFTLSQDSSAQRPGTRDIRAEASGSGRPTFNRSFAGSLQEVEARTPGF